MNIKTLLTMDTHALGQWDIPYRFDGFERLKSIIKMAKKLINTLTPENIQLASDELRHVRHWYYDVKKTALTDELQQELNHVNHVVNPYIDVKRCINEQIDVLKLQLVADVDLFNYILFEDKFIKAMRDIPCLQSDLSNSEYFAVLALYQVGKALAALDQFQVSHQQQQLDDIPGHLLTSSLASAFNHTIEAQVAVDQAIKLNESHSVQARHMSSWLHCARQDWARKAVEAKHGKNSHLRREKAIELFKQGHFTSDHQAAKKIAPILRRYSEEHGLPHLKPDAEVETIRTWIRRYKKANTS